MAAREDGIDFFRRSEMMLNQTLSRSCNDPERIPEGIIYWLWLW